MGSEAVEDGSGWAAVVSDDEGRREEAAVESFTRCKKQRFRGTTEAGGVSSGEGYQMLREATEKPLQTEGVPAC